MTLQQQIQIAETDLDIALTDAHTLVRYQLSAALLYLRDGQRWEICEIRSLLSELLAELTPEPALLTPVVSINTSPRWMN